MSQPPLKQANVAENAGASPVHKITMPSIELLPERRKELMAHFNIVEPVQEEESEWIMEGVEYDGNEDLLNMRIPPKRQEFVTDPTGARLIIQTIYVENFKSYKGRHQLGPFHKNLTMILGPNGSGKSNVIDALLFVFGFNKRKIRTQKWSALINSQSDSNYCNVEIHYQMIKDINVEKYKVIPDSSFVISRAVNRENASQYKINGVIAQQSDVQALLGRAGIDVSHNRFLILQGEVEAIALMKPTVKNPVHPGDVGMLEYIEDIVGTDRFVVPIAKLAHRVKQNEIKISQYTAGVRRAEEVSLRFQPAMKATVAFINATNELNYMKGVNHKDSIAKIESSLDMIEENIDKRKERLEELAEARNEAVSALKEAVCKEARLNRSRDAVNIELLEIDKQITQWYAEDQKNKNILKKFNKEWREALKEMETAENNIESLKHLASKCDSNLEQIRMEIEELKNQEIISKKEADDGRNRFELKSAVDLRKQEELEKEFGEKSQHCAEIEANIVENEAELSEMRVTAGQGGKRLEDMQKALDETQKKVDDDTHELARLENDKKTMESQLATAKYELPSLQHRALDGRTRLQKAGDEFELLKNQKETYNSRCKVTRALLEYREKKGFNGYLGRLGDLGCIASRFDAAISTVCGGSLDLQIVETYADAAKGVDFLRKYKVGRGNFFALEYLDAACPLPTPKYPAHFPGEKVIEFIECDEPRARRVFHYFVGNIIVVSSLAEATRLEPKLEGKFRVVTIEGAVVESNGNMTGGGLPKFNKMRTDANSVTNTQTKRIAALPKIIESLEKEQPELERRCANAVENIKTMEADLVQINKKLEELKSLRPNQKNRMNQLKKAIEEHKIAAAHHHVLVSEEEMDAKRAALIFLRTRRDKTKAELTGKEKQLKSIRTKLDRMYYEFSKKHLEQSDKAKERIIKLEEEAAKEAAMKRSAPARIKLATKVLEETQIRVTIKRRELDMMEAQEMDHSVKVLREFQHTASVTRQSFERLHEKIEVAKSATIMAASAEKLATNEYTLFKANMDALQQSEAELKGQLEMEKAGLEKVNESWVEPENLVPDAAILRQRYPGEDLSSRVNAEGFVILPPEVLESMTDFKEKHNSTPVAISSDREMTRTRDHIIQLEKALERFRRNCDERGIYDYAVVKTLLANDSAELDKANDQVAKHRAKLNDMRQKRYDEFHEALLFLGTTTQVLYQLITNGGDASLKFVEGGKSADPFDAGVKFSVRPAKKSWKLIENLSGGEKTLASLCFVFAMHHYRATPLYVMDEIDAALDLNNVRLIANYIKHSDRTKNAQFVIISLRNQMFEVGNRLVGIYKVDGCTRNVVISPVQVENGHKTMKVTLDEKIQEENKKRPVETDAEAEKSVIVGVKNLAIKRRRKLGRIVLSDFGLDDNEDENEDPTTSRASSQPVRAFAHDDDSYHESDEDETPVRRRRRQVAEEFDEEEEEEEEEASPTPPPVPKPSARPGRRSRK